MAAYRAPPSLGFSRQEHWSGLPFPSPMHESEKWKSLSSVLLLATPWTAAHQVPPSTDSPGKNTGVGCHSLLQCMKVKSESEVAQLCPTLSHPMDCSLPDSSVHGIFQARVLEWGAIAFSELVPTHVLSSFSLLTKRKPREKMILFILFDVIIAGTAAVIRLPGE